VAEKSPLYRELKGELQLALEGVDKASKRCWSQVPELLPGEAAELRFEIQYGLMFRATLMIVPDADMAQQIVLSFLETISGLGPDADPPVEPRRQ
jgi:hypothetical protein